MSDFQNWPPLPLNEWQDTYRTLHMWTQIVGKIRMTLSPPLNHWWHVTLYVNSRGLTTGPVPYPPGVFEIQFDFQKDAVRDLHQRGRQRLPAARSGVGRRLLRRHHGVFGFVGNRGEN